MANLYWDINHTDFSPSLGSGTWGDYDANWSFGFDNTARIFADGDNIYFDSQYTSSGAPVVIDVERQMAPGQIWFSGTSGREYDITFTGQPIEISTDIRGNDSGVVEFAAPIVGSTDFSVTTLDLTLSGTNTHTGMMSLVRSKVTVSSNWNNIISVGSGSTVINSGQISRVDAVGGDVTNSLGGTIGQLVFDGGTVLNFGQIDTLYLHTFAAYTANLGSYGTGTGRAINGDDGNNSLTVQVFVDGDVSLRDGIDIFNLERFGTIDGDLQTGRGGDIALIRGMVTGNLRSGHGNDDLTIGSDGTITGDIRGGTGNDTVAVNGTVNGPILGMDGEDEIIATGSASAVKIVGGIGDDVLYGSALDDTILGGADGDFISAGDGDDVVRGGDANDYLGGDGDSDILHGGLGKDTLSGGTGADRFIYGDAAESTAGTEADRINDFLSGTDTIVLRRIDADTTTAGNQAFTFIGTAEFSNTAGELRFVSVPAEGKTSILGDRDGDGVADFQIDLTGGVTLLADDFIL